MLSRTQAESGRTAKEEQERISPNHVPTIFHFSVYTARWSPNPISTVVGRRNLGWIQTIRSLNWKLVLEIGTIDSVISPDKLTAKSDTSPEPARRLPPRRHWRRNDHGRYRRRRHFILDWRFTPKCPRWRCEVDIFTYSDS